MAGWSMRDKTCIVGVGTTEYGSFPETDAYGLGVKALNLALEDCGLGYEDIDGLIVNRIAYDRFSQITNINPQYMLATEAHGRFSAVSLMLAARASLAGSHNAFSAVKWKTGKST